MLNKMVIEELKITERRLLRTATGPIKDELSADTNKELFTHIEKTIDTRKKRHHFYRHLRGLNKVTASVIKYFSKIKLPTHGLLKLDRI